jgi:NhaA family Na+:H+ antiporter
MTTHVVASYSPMARRGHGAKRLWRLAIDHYALLPLGGIVALLWANTLPESYFTMAQRLAFPVNEIGMALFFGLVTQEIVEATLPGSALHTSRRWLLPVAAAIGATLGGAAVYLAYINLAYEVVLAPGWPIAGAIDLAFVYFIVKSIFGRHPAVPFALMTAIVADLLGTAFIASRQDFVAVQPGGTALMLFALAGAWTLRKLKFNTFWPYLLLCGPLSWLALYLDGFHPALALVPIIPFVPHAHRGLDLFQEQPHSVHDSPRHFEHVWHDPVQVVLFLFALVNAGVLLREYDTGTWALLAAALIGKPVGLIAACAGAVAAGLHLPKGLHWKDLAVIAPATAASFTFGLFFATAIFPLGPVLEQMKLAAVLTGVAVPLTYLAAMILRVGRFKHRAHLAQ